MRPIDADELIKHIEKGLRENPHEDGRIRSNHTNEYMHFLRLVNRMPTVPLAVDESKKIEGGAVVHGRWIEHRDSYENYCECSVCHYCPDAPLDSTNYCPNCGTKMDLEEAP